MAVNASVMSVAASMAAFFAAMDNASAPGFGGVELITAATVEGWA